MYTIGLSSCGKEFTEALFQGYRDAGITAIEISTAAENYEHLDYSQIAAWAKQYGINLWSYHLPFAPFEAIDPSVDALAEGTVDYFESLIRKAAAIGIRVFIVHPSGEPIAEADRPTRMACAKKTLARLAEIAEGYGTIIAVENLPRTCLGRDSADMLELVSAHPALKVCFDTNHLLGEDPVAFIRKVGRHFITTHVSDYDCRNERHWLPGEGKLAWLEILAALKEVGYRGPWLYELGFASSYSISRPQPLTCKDFAENAYSLFAGIVPPPHDLPLPGLTGWK